MSEASPRIGSARKWWGALPALFLAVGALVCAHGTIRAAVVTFTQSSDPVGIVSQTSFPNTGTQVSTVTAPATSASYSFTHWTLNGVRVNDATGRSQNPATLTINTATTAVAHYLPTTQDSDADGIPDWYEIEYYGDLSQTAASDTDGDGIPLTTESIRAYHPLVKDTLEEGGVSRRRAPTVSVVLNNNYVVLTQSSSPAGFVDSRSVVLRGSTVALATVPESGNGYQFTGWLVNGIRTDSGLQNQPASITVNGATTAVARYIPATADTDADGVADWFELFYYDTLANNGASDTDADGINLTTEAIRGYPPNVADSIEEGGISRRRSATAAVNLAGFSTYRLTSVPAGFVDVTATVADGTLVTTLDLWGQVSSGYNFAYWDRDGVRQADAYGIALGTLTFSVTADTTATAHYLPTTQDSDGDGVADWVEYTYYGSLGQSGSADTDGDGFDLTTEAARGSSPVLVDEIAQGGISRRRNGTNTVFFYNPPPTLTAPAANSVTASLVSVAFTLPRTALAGSVTLTFGDGVTPRVLTLAGAQESSGAHSFSFDPANPTATAAIASGPAIPDGTYTVTLSYRDTLGNTAVTASSTGVAVDKTGPAGGTMTLTPASWVNPAAALSVSFAAWADLRTPLTYQVLVDNVATNVSGTSATASFTGPTAPGTHTLKGRIADALGNVTEVTQGFTVNTPVESWRQFYFGSATADTGNDQDFNHNGVVNLLEFAFGTNPVTSAAGALQYNGTLAGGGTIGGTGQPTTVFESTATGIDFRALFVRRVDYVAAGLTYAVQFSADMQSWTTSAAVPAVLADDGAHQIVSVPYPPFVHGKKARFFRVQVSLAP